MGCKNNKENNQTKSSIKSCRSEATIEIDLSGTRERPILLLDIKNTGFDPIKVDNELVFLVNINIVDRNEIPIELEESSSVSVPDRSSLEKRFVLVQPANSIQRKIDLRKSFKYFVYRIGISKKFYKVSAYEVLCRLPAKVNPECIDVIYSPLHGFREGFLQYTGIESTSLGLFEGPLRTSIDWNRLDCK